MRARSWLLLLLCLLMAALAALGCGPPPEAGTPPARGTVTAGMCPKCGGTSFDVETNSERSPYTGEPTEYLTLTCRECGHSWRSPAAAN